MLSRSKANWDQTFILRKEIKILLLWVEYKILRLRIVFLKWPFPIKWAFFRHYSQTQKNDLSVHLKNVFVGGKKINTMNSEFFDLQKNNAELTFD